MAQELEVLMVRLDANARNLERQMERANGIIRAQTKRMEQTTAASGARLTAIMSTAGARAGVAFTSGLGLLGAGGAVAGFGLTALVESARQAAAEIAKIGDVAGRVNVTAEALQALQFAAEQNAGSAEAVNSGLQRFVAGLADAKAGSGDLLAILKANGVAFTDVQGKILPTEQVLMRFADIVQNARTPAEQLEFAIRAFGRSAGPELVGLLSQGSSGIRQMMQQAKDAGAVLNNELVEKAQKIDDKFTEIGRTVKVQVGGAIISVISTMGEFVEALNRANTASANLAKTAANLPKRIPVIGGSDVHEGDLAADLKNGIARLPNTGGRGTSYDPNDLTPASGPYRPSRSASGNAPGSGRATNRFSVLPSTNDGGGGASKAQAAAERLVESYRKLQEGAKARIADLQAEQQALGLTTEAAEALRFRQELLNRAKMADLELSPAQLAEIDKLAQQYGALSAAVDQAAESQQFLQSLGKEVLGGFVSDLRQGKSAAEALSNALDKVLDKVLDLALNAVFDSKGGGAGILDGFIKALTGGVTGGRASGGPVQSGSTYLVGENGPEMVRFGRNGTVVPNSAMRGGGSGGGAMQVVINNNAGAEVSTRQVDGPRGQTLEVQLERMVNAHIASGRADRALGQRAGMKGR